MKEFKAVRRFTRQLHLRHYWQSLGHLGCPGPSPGSELPSALMLIRPSATRHLLAEAETCCREPLGNSLMRLSEQTDECAVFVPSAAIELQLREH